MNTPVKQSTRFSKKKSNLGGRNRGSGKAVLMWCSPWLDGYYNSRARKTMAIITAIVFTAAVLLALFTSLGNNCIGIR